MARSMLSFGIEASRAFCTARASAGLPSGSPPPSRAATVIARVSFVKRAPRFASTAFFLCLIDAHLEWPAMSGQVYFPDADAPRRDGQPEGQPEPSAPRGRQSVGRRSPPRPHVGGDVDRHWPA